VCDRNRRAHHDHRNEENPVSEKHSDDGASLILVLGVFGGLLAMVLALLPFASTNIVNSARFKSHVDKTYAADGGLKLAIQGVLTDSATGLASTVLPDGSHSCSSQFGKTITLTDHSTVVTCEFAADPSLHLPLDTYPAPGRQSECPAPSGTSVVLTPAYTCYFLYGNKTQGLTTTAGAPAQKEVGTSQILVPRGDLDVVFLVDTTNGMNATGNAAIDELKKNSVLSQLFDDMPADARYRVAQYRDFTSPNQWTGTNTVSCPVWTNCSGLPYTISPSWMAASDAKNYFRSSSFIADPGTQDENAEADLYGLYRVLKDPGLWRTNTTRAVIWIGDSPSHTPICQALDAANIAVSSIDKTTIGGMVAGVQMFSISLSTNGNGLDNLNSNTSNNELSARCNTASGNTVKDQATYIDARGAQGSRHYSNVTVAQLSAQIHMILESLRPAYVTSTVSAPNCVTVSPDAVADEDGKARFNETFQADSGMSGTSNCDVTFKIYDPATTPPTLKEVDVEKNTVTVIPNLRINFTVTVDGQVAAKSQATYDLFHDRALTINSWHLL
jgi:hypothetical protein